MRQKRNIARQPEPEERQVAEGEVWGSAKPCEGTGYKGQKGGGRS